jgi:hypothetical protein
LVAEDGPREIRIQNDVQREGARAGKIRFGMPRLGHSVHGRVFVGFRQVLFQVRLQAGVLRQELAEIFALHPNGQFPTAGPAAGLKLPPEQVRHQDGQPVQQFPALALAQVFDLFGNMGKVGLTGPAGAKQPGVAHGPLVEILFVEVRGGHASTIGRHRGFNCSGSTA